MKKGLVTNIQRQLQSTDFPRIIGRSADVITGSTSQNDKERAIIVDFLEALRDATESMICNGEKVSIKGIVTLEPVTKPPRMGYSFDDKKIVEFPERTGLRVSVSRKLKEMAKEGKKC